MRGLVQGVGFRPYVHALAHELGLSGSVCNTADGVRLEVEGPAAAVESYRRRLVPEAPPLARVESVDVTVLEPRGGTAFEIRPSDGGAGRTFVSPDVATCADCTRELRDPGDRRHRHPFISCTNCGPRYTIVVAPPYDRATTTMAGFPMCPRCAAEYADPRDRRFHAQPVCCPDCGPRLWLRAPGAPPATGEAALAEARRRLAGGAIVAVKGLGGYHLACDAGDDSAVRLLRKRKNRGDKPFAVLVADLATARRLCRVDEAEAAALTGHHRPIVLLARHDSPTLDVAAAVAPGNPDLGLMLPPTALHQLLLGLPDDPPGPPALVLTSGNLSGEPLATDDPARRDRRRLARPRAGDPRAVRRLRGPGRDR